MALEHYLGIGSIAIIIGFIIYKRITRGETLKDIYKKIDDDKNK
jgi:hypothetical protein